MAVTAFLIVDNSKAFWHSEFIVLLLSQCGGEAIAWPNAAPETSGAADSITAFWFVFTANRS
jgi:hypothetical protein